MMHSLFNLAFPVILLVASVSTAPSQKLDKRYLDTSSYCGQWDSVSAGPYSLLLDQWGKTDAYSGSSQCASLTSFSASNNTISWKTTYNWDGGSQVKSFANIQMNDGLDKQLSTIHSIPTNWEWKNTACTPLVADVAYDMFTSTSPGGANNLKVEVMIWLANFNSGPISYNYGSNGRAISVANSIPLAGHKWDIYSGTNGVNEVYSFLPANNDFISSFTGDLLIFLQWLMSNQCLSSHQYLTTLQAGTEATSGCATFASNYSLAII
ncbi:glycoside hydrolase family 12 protein [Tricholoma matsutake]|nr:glycoside hydrolase family 12 protein [Tricholoma matsutake 945]